MVANTIGAGIYTTSGFTLADLGSREAVMAVWFAASLLAITGAVSFGALARALPQSGGEYLYLTRLFHPVAGFIAGWVSLIAAFAGAQAYAAHSMIAYLPIDPTIGKVCCIALLISLASLHGVLVKAGTVIQNLTVATKAIFILAFVIVGAAVLEAPSDRPPTEAISTLWAWPVNLMWVSLSFTGFNSAIYVAEEAQNPKRDVPRAILIGTLITAVLYLLLNGVLLYSAPIEKLSGAEDIALVAAAALGGSVLENATRALVLLSLFTLISGMALAGPRVVMKMGEDGFLPPMSLSQAAFIQCFLSVVMTIWSDLVSQLSYLSLTLSLTSALTVATIFKLERQQRPPIVFPIVYIVGTLSAALASFKTMPGTGLAALITLATGGLAYTFLVARKRGT